MNKFAAKVDEKIKVIVNLAFHLPEIVRLFPQPFWRPLLLETNAGSVWRRDILPMLRRTLFASLVTTVLSIGRPLRNREAKRRFQPRRPIAFQ